MTKDRVWQLIRDASENNVTKLDLSRNRLTQIPPEIVELKDLTELDLSWNQLTQLPREVIELKNLTKLSLSHNQLTQLPSEIGKLRNLTELSLSHNQLTQIPSEIVELQDLIEFDLSWNQLTQLHPEVLKLKNLTGLYLSGNRLTQIPSEIAKLNNLTTLYFSGNRLTRLPPEIGMLKNVTRAYFSGNQLTRLPPEIGMLENVTILNLSDNQLTQLPREISKLEKLEILSLSKNPLQPPLENIISNGLKAIITFLKNTEYCLPYEAKLILVGEGDVGKTCLANRLVYNAFVTEKTTEGINVLKWSVPTPNNKKNQIKLNIWDFGGQEIYHATHQFFLTKNSVYILVWNARRSQNYDDIYYWLHSIEAFGKDSRVILVMSKKKENDGDLNLSDLKNRFPCIAGDLFKVDCKDAYGIKELKEFISEIALGLCTMRNVGVESWQKARKKLEKLDKNWIEYDDFCKICTSVGLNDENIELLDDYLHDIGIILHFKENIKLKGIVILKPQWLTEAFYKILSSPSVSHNDGILFLNELGEIWKSSESYSPLIYPHLLELMNQFELAYEIPTKKQYFLVTELLPQRKPTFPWDDDNNLIFYYSYDYYLPPGIITRFIVRMHKNLVKKDKNDIPLCWREGARLNIRNARVLVELKRHEKQIIIKIKGNHNREVLRDICKELDDINNSVTKINVKKEIPCKCSDNCPQRFSYDKLLEAEKKGIEKIQCHETFEDRPISVLLSGYKSKVERENTLSLKMNSEFFQLGDSTINIKTNFISKKEKDKIRIATVQLKINLSNSFPFKIENKSETLSKIYQFLEKAQENDCHIICFPELSFCEEWLPKIKDKYSNMIIIAGSYYNDTNNNVCHILFGSDGISTQLKITPAKLEEEKMIPGDCINIYETKFGTFAVLICRDFTTIEPFLRNKVDIIFVPSYNKDTKRFDSIADNHVWDCHSYIIISNCSEFGGTAIFGNIHRDRQNYLVEEGFKEFNDYERKLCEIKNGDVGMIIADFNLVYKSIQTPTVSNPAYDITPVQIIGRI